MKQVNVKKLVLLNLPYFLLGLFATNLGEAWRLATGADASAKMLSFFSTLPVALGSWWPSLHPLDFLVGLCCGAGLRLAVYLKGKNAKKYRHNVVPLADDLAVLDDHGPHHGVRAGPPGAFLGQGESLGHIFLVGHSDTSQCKKRSEANLQSASKQAQVSRVFPHEKTLE